MSISEATIQEFIEVVKQDYGKELSLADATELIQSMVEYYDLLARIHHRTQKDITNQ